jgi:ubiquinone/menaquinone biosynthesis C-methylase UbiE
MTDRPFHRAAEYYDATRDLPEPLATAGIDAIVRYVRPYPEARVLEVGAGTGRISVPLLQRGTRLYGLDLARPMLQRLRAKTLTARVAEANAAQLPFGEGQFDGLLTVHVLHLVGRWREALREFRRVLKPGAAYVNSWHWHPEASIDQALRDYWRSRVDAHGGNWRRPGIQSREELLEEVRAMGAQAEEVVVTSFQTTLTPLSVVDGIARRVYSDTWEVPDDIFEATIAELRAYAAATYPDLNAPRNEEYRFILDVIRFA